MDDERHGLDTDLEASIASTDLVLIEGASIDAALELGAVAQVVGADVAGEIPIARSLLALVKMTKNVSTALLTRKVVRFLSQLSTISAADRERFLARLDGKDHERIIEDLLLVLDRHETQRKSEIQGKLFAALVREQLTTREYLDLTHATSAVNVNVLDELVRFYGDDIEWLPSSAQAAFSFASLQLVGIDNSRVGTYDSGAPEPTKIPLGQKFVDILSS